MPRDALIDVVTAAWELKSADTTWLLDLLGAATRAAGVEGGLAWTTELCPEGPRIGAVEGSAELAAWMSRDHAGRVPEAAIQRAYWQSPMVSTMRGAFDGASGGVPDSIAAELAAHGLRDVLLVAPRVGREVTTLSLPIPVGSRAATSVEKTVEAWLPVALHLRQAARVRRALAREPAPGEVGGDVMAEFDARGRGTFAVPELRGTLIEQARWTERRSERVTLWDDLLVGRYSIVAQRSQSGATRFVAIANPEGGEGLRALSPVERVIVERLATGDSQKAIAIDLGMRPTSLSSVVQRALAKLGLRHVMQLPALRAGLAASEARTASSGPSASRRPTAERRLVTDPAGERRSWSS